MQAPMGERSTSAASLTSERYEPPPTAAVAQTAPDANHEPPEEEYVPEPTAGEEEYVPEEVPQEGAAPDLEQLLAAGASDPEVLAQALAALPADQREAFEAQLKDAGVM